MKKLINILFILFISVVCYPQLRITTDGEILNCPYLDTRLGVINVKNSPYNATGDGTTNDTQALQRAIDSAGNGRIIIPPGTYLFDSLLIVNSPIIEGMGWGYLTDENNTVLQSNRDFSAINIRHSSADEGGCLRNLTIRGSVDADSSSQHGIYIDGIGEWTIENVKIYKVGGYAIRFADNNHSIYYTIRKCNFENNYLGGIYGRRTSASQKNAINIIDNHIISNYGYGINLIGQNINILRNTIEYNDSSGIYLSARDMGSDNCSSYGMNIKYNYFEANEGGEIYAEYFYDATPTVQYHYNLVIEDNVFISGGTYDKVDATGCINFRAATGSSTTYGFNDLYCGRNYFLSTGVYNIDAGNAVDGDGFIFIDNSTTTPTDEYVNLYLANTEREGDRTSSRKTTTSVVAGTGITEAMLSPNMFIDLSAAIDITADPQIVDGWVDGLRIKIRTDDDTHTLTLDNGTGLLLEGGVQFVMGEDDIIELEYDSVDDVWREIGRTDN